MLSPTLLISGIIVVSFSHKCEVTVWISKDILMYIYMNIYTYLQIDTDVIKFETDSYSVLSSKSKFKTCLKCFFWSTLYSQAQTLHVTACVFLVAASHSDLVCFLRTDKMQHIDLNSTYHNFWLDLKKKTNRWNVLHCNKMHSISIFTIKKI